MNPAIGSPSAVSPAEALAARLRLISAGMADDDPDLRRNFLSDEIGRALKPLPPGERASLLRAVAEHFPTWGLGEAEAQAPAPAVAPNPADEPTAALVARLAARLGALKPEERASIAAELVAAGLPANTGAVPAAQMAEFWRRFQIADDDGPHFERTLRLLGALAEVYMSLDQLVWTLWRTLDAKSPYKKEFEFAKLAGPYLQGDSEVSTDQIRQTLERTRKLIAALIGASARAAHDFGEEHNGLFSPEAIEGAAQPEKGFLGNLDAASWRKYKQLHSASGGVPQIEAAIQRAIARAAEDLMGGRAR